MEPKNNWTTTNMQYKGLSATCVGIPTHVKYKNLKKVWNNRWTIFGFHSNNGFLYNNFKNICVLKIWAKIKKSAT